MKRLEERKIHVELTDARQGPAGRARATTRPTARGRSSGRFSGGCSTRWRCGCSRASSARATRSSSTPAAATLTFEKRTAGAAHNGRCDGICQSEIRRRRFNPRGGDRRGREPARGRARRVAVVRPRRSCCCSALGADVLPRRRRAAIDPLQRVQDAAQERPGRRGRRSASRRSAARSSSRRPARKPSKQFTTTRVEDPKLTEELEAHGVKYTGEVDQPLAGRAARLDPPARSSSSRIWGFFFRRMGGAEGGVMSFARSRAKIYADDDVKVRFADVAGVDEARGRAARRSSSS